MKRIVAFAFAMVLGVYACNLWHTVQPFAFARPSSLRTRADARRLERAVTAMVEAFPSRHGANPRALTAAGEWIEGQLHGLGLAPTRQTFVVNGHPYFNVLVRLGPERGRSLVVGAHYDSHPETPGADDNASGVATLLEVARLLAAEPLRCPVQVAFWTLEEPPFFRTDQMGSVHHARALRAEGVPLGFAVSLEMVGYFTDAPGSQRYPPNFPFTLAYPSKGNFLLLLGDSSSTGETARWKAAFAGGSALPIHSVNVSRTRAGADFQPRDLAQPLHQA